IYPVEENLRHTAKEQNPIHLAVKDGFSDTIVAAFSIKGQSGRTHLIDLGEYLYSPQMEWANYRSRIGLRIDRNRSNWGKVKNYPKNTEIETAGTYTSGSSTVPVNLRYSFSEIPQTGYKPR